MAPDHHAPPVRRVRSRGPVPTWIPLLGCTSVSILSTGLYTLSLASFLVGAFHDGSALPMAVTLALFCAAGALGWLLLNPASRSAAAHRAGRPAP